MKYAFMFIHDADLAATLPPGREDEMNKVVYSWFEEQFAAGNIASGGAELQHRSTATTVRGGPDGKPVVVDGPFSETKETVGGFSIIEAEDLDAALAIAKTWPMLGKIGEQVEVRPIVDHGDSM